MRTVLDAAHIHDLIKGLPEKHILKNSPEDYVNDFVAAALEVYKPSKLKGVLQDKFLIPDASNYTDKKYFESASELSVSRYLKQKEKENLIRDLAFEKKVNPKNKKDVDNFFRVKAKKVSIEVKCPSEEKQAPFPANITVQTAGRIPNREGLYNSLKSVLDAGSSGTNLLQGTNPDNRLKDCLLLANEKFSDESGFDELNILFVSCGYFHDINHWYMCLQTSQGLFTNASFEPPEHYQNVDLVILSNLKYRHEYARSYPAWGLDEVFLLPIINPHGRPSCVGDSVKEGLDVFHHYKAEFEAYNSIETVARDPYRHIEAINEAMKVSHFVNERLAPQEKSRFFPVEVP
jgi:hypothetical protein